MKHDAYSTRMQDSLDFYDTVDFNPSERPIAISGATRPWAPDGTYAAKLIGHRTMLFYGPRVEFIFEIERSEINRNVEGRFGMFFSVRRLIGPAGANGEFDAKGKRSKLAKLLRSASKVLFTTEDISIRKLQSLRWEITLTTPTIDAEGKVIPTSERYSVISEAVPIDAFH